MAAKTRNASAQVAQVPDAAAGIVLERIREQLGATDVVLWNAAGQSVSSAGQSRFSLHPERPGAAQLRTVRQQRATAQIEGLDDIADPAAARNARVKVLVLAWVLGLLGVSPFAATFGGALGGELSSVLPVHAPGGVGTYPAGITAGAAAFGADRSRAGLSVLAEASINAHLMIVASACIGTALSVVLSWIPARVR